VTHTKDFWMKNASMSLASAPSMGKPFNGMDES
jgi:hypothetical protein